MNFLTVCVRLTEDKNEHALPTPGVENSGEEINGWHPRNAKLFNRIEHSGIRLHKCKLEKSTTYAS